MRRILLTSFLTFFFSANIYAGTSQHRPELVIRTMSDKTLSLEKMHGKVVLINFWASWCGECKKEIQILNEIHAEYEEQDLEIIGISVDSKRAVAKVRDFAKNIRYPVGMFYDIVRSSFEYPSEVPITYLVDQNGELHSIVGDDDGEISKENFRTALDSLIRHQ